MTETSDSIDPRSPTNTEVAGGEDVNAMTEHQRAEAKRYHRAQLTCDVIDRVIDATFLLIVALVFAVSWDRWLEQTVGLARPAVRLAAMYLLLTGLHFTASFGLSYYSGFVLEHKFALSRQSFQRWLSQYGKRVGLTLVFGLLLTEGLYAIIWTTGRWWWLVAALVFFAVSVIVGQLFPVLILPLFQKSERLDDGPLVARFRDLSKGTGLTIEGIYRLKVSEDTSKANAQLAGLGATRRVLLDDTLLDRFDNDELVVIFAHEVGHHVHRHIPKMVALGVLYSALLFIVSDRVLASWVTHIDGQLDYARFPVYALPMFNLLFMALSLLLEPIQNLISRHFERQSDRYALDKTGLHGAFRSAFLKLAKLNKADMEPPWLEVKLFHSHPPIAERLRMAQG